MTDLIRGLRAAAHQRARDADERAREYDADVTAYASSGQWNTMYCQHARLAAACARLAAALWRSL